MFRQVVLIFLTVQPKIKKEAITYWGPWARARGVGGSCLPLDFHTLSLKPPKL